MRIKFAKDVSAVEQRNYLHLNACIVYDLDIQPNNPLRNFTLKVFLFGVISIVKISDGIASDGKETQNFGNDFSRTSIIFGVDNSSSSHANNRKVFEYQVKI